MAHDPLGAAIGPDGRLYVTLFVSGIVNPSVLEVAASLTFWVAGLVLVSGSHERLDNRLVTVLGMAGCALALSRQLGPLWLGLIALTLVCLIAAGLLVLNWKTIRTFENFRPLVIRIDDLGRAEAINYHNLEYQPQDAEAKYFLSQFCELYYRRNRYTIQSDFARALYFLDGKLANGILDAYRKDDIIKKFLTNTGLPEVDVEVKKVALEEMQPPYKARVDFYMVYYSPDHTELKRDLYTANFVFVFRKHVPNELIPINPLGLTISYFREDQAFK